MNFDFSSEQQQLGTGLRRFLQKECPSARVRSAMDGAATHDVALWKELAGLGFVGAAIDEEYGGAGLGYLELCVVAEEVGRSLAPVPMSSCVYLFAEFLKRAGTSEQKRTFLPGIASGEVLGTLAYVEGSGEMAPERIRRRSSEVSSMGGRML